MANQEKANRKDGGKAPKLPLAIRLFPFLKWIKGYTTTHFRVDLLAGITVALVLIPQSMAYAQLAGLPAYYGLYAAFLPPMLASLFGSSNQLATGPVAVVSLMTAVALEPLATEGSASFITYAVLLAFLVGVFQFLLGVLRLGLIVNLLSHPVVNGFTNAAAIIIATSQLSKLFGVYVDKAEHHYETIYNVLKAALDSTHWPSLGLAILAIGIMVGLKRLNRKIPNVLVAVIVTTLISKFVGFENNIQTTIQSVESPEVTELIQDYNEALEKAVKLGEAKVTIRSASNRDQQSLMGLQNACFKCHTNLKDLPGMDKEHAGGASANTMLEVFLARPKYQIDLLELAIKKEKEEVRRYRAQLRELRFAVGRQLRSTADKRVEDLMLFYPDRNLPKNVKRGQGKWRLKVGQKQLDEERLTFVGGGAVVGVIPEGLPRLAKPQLDLDVVLNLLPMVLIISLLGFMEAISIAKAMAAKTGQVLDPNQELIGQGMANMVGSIGQSYPTSGSFSRSAVNLQAGAMTGLSNVFSSCVVVITLLFLTPLLYHLPQSVLASIIMMAVFGLLNIKGFVSAWRVQKHDGIISIITFLTTLVFAPHLDRGIFIGIGLSLGFYLFRTMKPQINTLSRYMDGSYRNAETWGLMQCRHIAVIRFSGSLFFTNVSFLEEQILERISSMPELKHIHIVGNGINEIDASGEETLAALVRKIHEAGYEISFSGLNDSVLDALKRTGLHNRIGKDKFFRYVADAIERIHEKPHLDSDEDPCPLITSVFKGWKVSSSVQRMPEILQHKTKDP